MIDFHSHVLPHVDDGSSSMTETEQLLSEQIKQAAHIVIATPHFYANQNSISHFIERRDQSLKQVEALLLTKDWKLEIKAGAEVYYFPGMGGAWQLRQLSIQGTDLILIELPFVQWTDAIYQDVRQVIEKQKLTVILAHVERYYDFQKKKDIWNRMFELPVIPQINVGSFLSRGLFHHRKSSFCYEFMKSHRILLGSDCHNMDSRRPNLAQGRAEISARLGDGYIQQLDSYAERILNEHAGEAKV